MSSNAQAAPATKRLGASYWRLFTASTVSNVGDGILQVAFPLYVASLTRDPIAVAGIAFAQQLPWTLAAPLAGVLADRIDRRRILVVADVGRAALLGAFAISVASGDRSIAVAYVVAFVLGGLESLFDVTSGTIVPSLVRRDQLDVANGRLFASELVAENFAAPPLGALCFAIAAALPFAADAASFSVSALILVGLSGRFVVRPNGRATRTAGVVRTAASEAASGFRLLWADQRLRGLTAVSGGIGVAEWSLLALLVLYTLESLGASQLTYALLLAVATVGAFGGSVAAARLGATDPERTFLASTAVHGFVALLVATAPNVVVAGAGLAAWGFAIGVSNVMYVGIRQRHVPNPMLGRVGGALGLVNGLAGTIGAIGAGLVAAVAGVRAPIAVGGVIEIAVVVVVALWWRQTRVLRTERAGIRPPAR